MRGFVRFIREQGIIGLAVGFLLGGSASRVVSSLVNDILNPLIALGRLGQLKDYTLPVGNVQILLGSFLSNILDFLIIAAVVYFVFKGLGLEKIDRPKVKPEEIAKKKAKK